MNSAVEHLAEKIQSLNPEQIAEVEDFVDFLRLRLRERTLVCSSNELTAPAFAAIWNNPEEDGYDGV